MTTLDPRTTTAWTRQLVAGIALQRPVPATPVIDAHDVMRVPGLDLWDPAPICDRAGAVVSMTGAELWLALSAPAAGDPGERHFRARLRLLARRGSATTDLGDLFVDGASLGSSEWAGCGVLDRASGLVRVYYTAAGWRDRPGPSFAQRIAEATGRLVVRDERAAIIDWSAHREAIVADDRTYVRVTADDGEPGFIKAFRDPAWFCDPADDREYLLFCASSAQSTSDFNGAIGVAHAAADGWELLPPLVAADGVNNELERPHIVVHDGHYYLFFSTQARTFDPAASGPTGLYGFVGETVHGPWTPLNGTGLIFRNPPAEPTQAYSWIVLADLRAVGFVDAFGLAGTSPDELATRGGDAVRERFGGTFTPTLQLALAGTSARLVQRA